MNPAASLSGSMGFFTAAAILPPTLETEMRKLILYRAQFTNEYVARIEAAIPDGWHLIQSWKTGAASAAAPDVLCTLSGSVTQQKTQTLKVRFAGGAAAGAFTLPLEKLGAFLESLSQN